jgi:hypothetical protein
MVFNSFNLVGRAEAFLFCLILFPPLAQLAPASRCRWYRAQRCRFCRRVPPIGKIFRIAPEGILPVGIRPGTSLAAQTNNLAVKKHNASTQTNEH